jgi:exopolysaccharide biosynthesis polyprenyl glycosylphosphotransferase
MRRLLVVADVTGLLVAFALTQLLFGSRGQPDALDAQGEMLLLLVVAPLFVLGAKLFGLYDRDEERADYSTVDDLVRVFLLTTVAAFLVIEAARLTKFANPEDLKQVTFWALTITAVTACRICVRSLARRTDAYHQNTVIVGAGDVGQLVARKLLLHREYGIDLLGFVDADPKERRPDIGDATILGRPDELMRIVRERRVDRVIFAFSNDRHPELLELVRSLRDSGVQVDIVPRLFEIVGPRIDVHAVEGIPLVGLPPVRIPRSSRLIKRSVDIVGATFGLVLLAPLFAAVAVAIKWDSRGPVFFRQQRLGKDMRPFTLLKFRTMHVDADDAAHRAFIAATMSSESAVEANGRYKLERPAEITRVGRWLRKTSLDELPQLVNVLKGDMSLVGPRPCLSYEVEHFAPHHFDRFLVPAGLTGLWQVSARAHSTFGEALDLDVLYAHSWSLGLDLSLLARTPLQLLRTNATA